MIDMMYGHVMYDAAILADAVATAVDATVTEAPATPGVSPVASVDDLAIVSSFVQILLDVAMHTAVASTPSLAPSSSPMTGLAPSSAASPSAALTTASPTSADLIHRADLKVTQHRPIRPPPQAPRGRYLAITTGERPVRPRCELLEFERPPNQSKSTGRSTATQPGFDHQKRGPPRRRTAAAAY